MESPFRNLKLLDAFSPASFFDNSRMVVAGELSEDFTVMKRPSELER
jgi:hypothetical protein